MRAEGKAQTKTEKDAHKARRRRRERRKSRKPPSMMEAVSSIQAMYRRRKAWILARKLIVMNYEKVYDEGSKTFFYYNKVTGVSQWYKPLLLGSADLFGA